MSNNYLGNNNKIISIDNDRKTMRNVKEEGKNLSSKKSGLDWWITRIRVLQGLSAEAIEHCPEIAEATEKYEEEEKTGSWTFLKLLTLQYYVSVYTTIAKSRFGRIAYIDLCAGDGFNRIKEINEVIVGSPVIAHIIPRKRTKNGKSKEFDTMILVEKNPKKADRLKKVMPDSAYILNADANSEDTKNFIKNKLVEEDIKHFFAFVDPNAMEVHWKTIEELLVMKGDLIINFMTSPIQRIWGSYFSDNISPKLKPKKEKFDNFFGDESWTNIPSPEEGGKIDGLLDFYMSKIREHREIVIPIHVRGLRGLFHYHMLAATRRTSGPQRWLESIERVRNKVETVTDSDIKYFFRIYRGKQKTLDSFYTSKE
ncbi:hypothetical protein ES704_02633 [subsurface metagenome]